MKLSNKKAMKKSFKSYSEALKYVDKISKAYPGGKRCFQSSEEYAELYPIVKKLYEAEKRSADKKLLSEAKKAMKEAGINFGDRVETQLINIFGLPGSILEGRLISKKGLPYVKLDHPFQGKKTIFWHKGWRKIE
jgi:tRNA nucleotidyltransferase/poly(A) polymerase